MVAGEDVRTERQLYGKPEQEQDEQSGGDGKSAGRNGRGQAEAVTSANLKRATEA